MIARIRPSKICGSVVAPPSKSMAHRYIICASLAKGKSRISNIAYSEDIKATLDCVCALGAKVDFGEDFVDIIGFDPKESIAKIPLNVRESGSTLRFLIPVALISGNRTEFLGKERLFARPLGVYEKIAADYGFEFEKKSSGLTVRGKLRNATFNISENKSSQFISGLLFALPLLNGDSEIVLAEYPESKSYIDMTLAATEIFGVRSAFNGERTYHVAGNQRYVPHNVTVEGDCSNAAFFEALNYFGGNVEVAGMSPNVIQGDAIYAEYFEKIKKGNAELDVSDCPDLAPILLTLLAEYGGGKLVGTRRLKFKESDRGTVMKRELAKFGAVINCFENEITVENVKLHSPKEPINSNSDHRVVMATAALATKYGGTILGCDDCSKSMPNFFEKLGSLGADIEITDE